MKKKYRVRKNTEFSKIISLRKRISNISFLLYYKERREEGIKIGISVSKKLGNAVVRNKIKRQIRMMFIEIGLNKMNPKEIVVIAKKEFLDFNYIDNKKNLEKLLKTSKII